MICQKCRKEIEDDKLKKYIEFLKNELSIGMSVPLSILFGSTPLPAAPNTHAIHLEDNEEEVATEDPPANNFRLVNGFTCNMTEIKQHPMDRHYPHICFKCKHDLIWRELVTRNIHWEFKRYLITFKNDIKIVSLKNWIDNIKQYRHLKQLWRSSVVQFYCCDCYDEMMEEL